jgi:flagellar protein FlaF
MITNLEKALNAYKKMYLKAQSGREVEASVLTDAALALKKWKDQWQTEGRHAGLRAALKYNQRVWSILQAELVKPNNPLPRKLRENILSLSVFVDRRIFEILADPSPDKLSAIIDINLNIAAGLRGSVSPKDDADAVN